MASQIIILASVLLGALTSLFAPPWSALAPLLAAWPRPQLENGPFNWVRGRSVWDRLPASALSERA
jgi:hypothetical protein